jgi:hypothetical protein
VVTAFTADTRITIGQVAAGDKGSEITAMRSLLGLIDLIGALVTGDALHSACRMFAMDRLLRSPAGGEKLQQNFKFCRATAVIVFDLVRFLFKYAFWY